TFFISPSTSASSLSSSIWSSGPSSSYASRETQPAAMPGPTPTGYLSNTSSAVDDDVTTAGSAQRRPHSSRSRRSSRSANPLFTRWGRRHQQHQHHDFHDRHNGYLQDPNGSDHSSPESQPSSGNNPGVKRPVLSRSSNTQKRQSQTGAMPQMTRQEFEALPLAIQRKYFSTLERLRFAQESGLVDGISQHYDDISRFRRRKSCRDRSVSEHIHRKSPPESEFSVSDLSPSYVGLPGARQKEYSRDKQVVLARRLRASVILDAADEAIYKLNRRASRHLAPSVDTYSTPPSPRPNSMDSHVAAMKSPPAQPNSRDVPQSFYESFRWLEEEEDLDLRLFLDDYHANLREGMPSPTEKPRPSFRRHLSISKIPFSRNSVSMSRPGTKDTTSPTSPTHSPSGSASNPFGQTKRKSRALSLITPKHSPQESITAFDPAAAHYQDPEARLKLRVYLASPQKFDEAIEFGFPSIDMFSGAPVPNDGGASQQRQERHKWTESSPNMRSFLADEDDDEDDDKLSLHSDQLSVADPDSPTTPHTLENKPTGLRHLRMVSADPAFLKDSSNRAPEVGGYAQAPASSREMTLRMTLTRPDLRANDDQIYGWQQKTGHPGHGRSMTGTAQGLENNGVYGDGIPKESLEKASAGMDHWAMNATDKGVMKRIWNRMRRS
ncbi:hypothetical protein B0T26DRAFT_604198, partial [Lasiosphaeria miniovina]